MQNRSIIKLTSNNQDQQGINQDKMIATVGINQPQMFAVPQFNYNPIYNGLNQQHQRNQQDFGQHPCSNNGQQASTELTPGDLFLDDDEDDDNNDELNADNDDVLNEIYHFTENIEKQSEQSEHNLQNHRLIGGRGDNRLISEQLVLGDNFALPIDTTPRHETTQTSSNQQAYFQNRSGKLRSINTHLNHSYSQGKTHSRRTVSNDSSMASNNQPLMINFQQPIQQITNNNNHDDCGGLFVEYQTNRNSTGGLNSLEELHSLNVTNCDSETLEEQINLLTQDNDLSFGTNSDLYQHDDYQGFNMNTSNDHFLNMLFMNSNNTLQNIDPLASCQNQASSNSSSLTNSIQAHQLDSTVSSLSDLNEPNSLHNIAPSSQCDLVSTKSLTKGSTNKTKITPNNNNKKSKPQPPNRCLTVNASRNNNKSGPAVVGQVRVQKTITTTNTNKQLLPKKGNANLSCNSRHQTKKPAQENWSNVNTSVNHMQFSNNFDANEPYKQQLENLRKKLRMDLGPSVSLTNVSNKSNKSTTSKSKPTGNQNSHKESGTNNNNCNDNNLSLSKQQQQQQQATYIIESML